MKFTSFVDSDFLGRGDRCGRIHFSVIITHDGIEDIQCWGSEYERYLFPYLHDRDQASIKELILAFKEDFDRFNTSYPEWLENPEVSSCTS